MGVSCNLFLNKTKTKEIIITNKITKPTLPTLLPSIERVTTMNVLGVAFNQHLSPSPHVDNLLSKGHQRLYGLKILKTHGLKNHNIATVTNAVLLSTLTYAAPAWRRFLLQAEVARLDSLLRKAYKWVFLLNRRTVSQPFAIK